MQEITLRKIILKDGTTLASEVTIWAAGVQGQPLAQNLSLVSTRIDVEPTLQVKNSDWLVPPAWFAWLFLRSFYLLGGRNKVLTMADWMWNYLTFDRGNRHIMDSE